MGNPYISPIYPYIVGVYGLLSPRIPIFSPISTMGTLLGVHPSLSLEKPVCFTKVEKLEGIFKAIDDGGDGMITEERLTYLGGSWGTSERELGGNTGEISRVFTETPSDLLGCVLFLLVICLPPCSVLGINRHILR